MRTLLYLILAFAISAVSCSKPYHLYYGMYIGYQYVPKGSVNLNGKKFTTKPFIIKDTEVTNKEYRTFLADLLLSGDTPSYNSAYPDTAMLRKELWLQSRIDYFNHPMFDDFPVVAVTKTQAEMYAKWLTQKVRSNTNQKITFRLPKTREWQYAAFGGRAEDTNYGWGKYDRNSKGCFLMHYFNLDFRAAIYGDDLGSHEILDTTIHHSYYDKEWDRVLSSTKNLKRTSEKNIRKAMGLAGAPVITFSYFPNDYGIYNMHGNVAEFVDGPENIMGGSYRTSSEYCTITNAKPFPFMGNAFPDVGFRLVANYVGPYN